MRHINSVAIHRVIVHVLDKNLEEPLLTDFEQKINEEIHDLLEKHIVRSLKDDENRIAKFISGPNIVRDCCDAMLYHSDLFIEESKKIARHLFHSMKRHGNTSSGDLVICIYSADDQKAVALLKMDYRKSYVHDIEHVDDKFKVSIVPQEIALPGLGQRLQKCAFIKPYESNNEYDLVLLDKQQRSEQGQEVAHFFADDFLNCNILIDSKDQTKNFRDITEKWVRSQLRQDVEQATKARNVLSESLKNQEEINVRSFAEEAFEDNKDVMNNYINHLNNEGFQVTGFEINKEWVDKKLKRKTIKTDTGFEIKNDYEYFDDRQRFQIKRNGDGTIDIIIKNVRNYLEK